MTEYKKSTDSTHPIDLQSSINSVYWRADVICIEEEAFFDVVTELVADDSDIEIEIKDTDGKVIHKLKEKIKNNFFKSSFKVPADTTGSLAISAKLPAHSLNMDSAPLKILAQPEITDAKWAKTEAEAAECIDFSATTANINEYSQISIEVYKNEKGKEELLESFLIQAGQNKLEGTWQEQVECILIETQEEADKLTPTEYFYKAKYKNAEAKSDILRIENYTIQEPPPEPFYFEIVDDNAFSMISDASKCTLEKITIKCSHYKDRKYELSITKDTPYEKRLLQVLSGSKTNSADELDITVGGTCDNFQPSTSDEALKSDLLKRPNKNGCCPAFKITGNNTLIEQPGPAKVKLLSKSKSKVDTSFVGFFKEIVIPSDIPSEIYEISGTTCNGEQPIKATIEAFPNVGWEGSVSLGFAYETHKDSNFNQNQGYKKLKVNGAWNISGSINAFYDSHKWDLGAKHSGQQHKDSNFATKGLFDGAQKVLNEICPLFSEIKSKYATVTINWPNITLSGGIKLIEKTNSNKVLPEGNVKISFAPLFGANLTVDVLNILITAASTMVGGPALANFLMEVREKAKEGTDPDRALGASAEIGIDFIIGAKIDGFIEWKTEDAEKWDTAGQVSPSIPIELKGYIKVEVKVFIVKIGAGAYVGATTSIELALTAKHENNKPSIEGKLAFTGITVYYAYFYEVKVRATKPKNYGPPPEHKKGDGAGPKKEKMEKFQWIKPAEVKWPNDSNKDQPLSI